MRYTIYNPNNLEVLYITQDLDESPNVVTVEDAIFDEDTGEMITPAVTMTIEFVPPENSLVYDGCTYHKPMVNQHPDPTHLVEGLTNDEIFEKELQIKLDKISDLNQLYTNQIDELVKAHLQKFIIDGTQIPSNILDGRTALRLEYRAEYFEIMGEYPDENTMKN